MDILDNPSNESARIISPIALENMQKAASWMRIVAIVIFIFLAIMIAFSVILVSKIPNGGMIMIVYVVLAAVYFFPTLFLYQSANSFKSYVGDSNQTDLENAFIKLNALYMFIGVLSIVGVAIFAIALLTGGAAMLAAF